VISRPPGTVTDIAEIGAAVPPLPDTTSKLSAVAASVIADPADVILGPDATERLAAANASVFLHCEMSLLMWWTVPAPGNEVPLG
jgi:hypothetical protein